MSDDAGSRSFGPMDVAGRSSRLVAGFEEAKVDALLVTDLTNIRYLTGFTGSAATLILAGDGELTFVTDGRYGQQATAQLEAAEIEATIEVDNLEQQKIITGVIAEAGVGRLGVEAEAVSWATARTYEEKWFEGIELVPTTALVSTLRQVKDDGEIDRLTAACTIADDALAEVRPRLGEQPTEVEFALELEAAMRHLGADDISFETIVASGPDGALPHHRAGRRIIVEGDLVVIDFGALVDGYHSDMTRTIMVGEPTPTQALIYEVVLEAQAAGVAAVQAGVKAKAVDAVCRQVIDAAGWLEHFLHSTGHGVGLDIHEDPRLSQKSTATLGDRSVVTVEPGVYLPDHGGVRIEDTVVVTPDGCRPLTRTPKIAAL